MTFKHAPKEPCHTLFMPIMDLLHWPVHTIHISYQWRKYETITENFLSYILCHPSLDSWSCLHVRGTMLQFKYIVNTVRMLHNLLQHDTNKYIPNYKARLIWNCTLDLVTLPTSRLSALAGVASKTRTPITCNCRIKNYSSSFFCLQQFLKSLPNT